VWLSGRGAMQAQIRSRLRENLVALDKCLQSQSMITRLEVEAGWYVVLRVPALMPDEELATLLVRDHGVAVHPGSSFGFAESGWLVLSLIAPPSEFLEGLQAVISCFEGP
jgi:alanine-synthesizing transaminase